MNSTKASATRKTGGLIGKNLIIFLVLLVVCALSIWAWFTSKTDATANGINIRAKADGVEVSWDGETWYKDLTARDESGVSGVTGPSKVVGTPEYLNLVTGNGLKFFEPYLNRRTGTVLMNGNAWQGREITTSNSEGRFIDVDLYFRGTSERDVFLAADSLVAPKNIGGNFSDFGAFSKDYIAAASRVAFLDANKENVSFIWAPNADVELEYDESGYTRVTDKVTEDITVSGGGNNTIDGGAVNDGKTYYLWTFKDQLIDTQAKSQDSSYLEPRVFTYDNEISYFVTELSFYIPTYEHKDPSIPVIINNSANRSDLSSNDSENIAGYDSLQNSHVDQHFFVANGEYNLDNNSIGCTNKMYADTRFINIGEHITVKFGYNPQNGILTVLEYESSGGGSFSLGGVETDVTTTVTYYDLNNNDVCALASPKASIAVSSGAHYMKAVRFTDSDKLNISPLSITSAERYTIEKTGDKHEATYKFKNASTNTYLSIANGTISHNGTGSTFTLEVNDDFNGPVLKSGSYYLVVDGGSVKSVTADKLDVADAVTVYTGSVNKLNTKVDDSQTYQYYDADANELKTLNSNTTPKLFTSTQNWSENDLIENAATTKVCDTKIVTLTKASEDDEYYTAHIVMRIWVEGTDREAKTPLADGLFDLLLHFTSQ